MSLIDCMKALWRFAGRRGIPSVIYSDNAKTFVAASSEVQKVYGHLSPKWKFTVPRSPWWGGWLERLVESVRITFKNKTLGIRYVSKNELETTLVEIESLINSRPLTIVSDELDFEHYLTPSHFILARNITSNPPVDIELYVVTPDDLRDREEIGNNRLEQFWNVWRKDCIANLPPVVKGFNQQCKLKVGSTVLVKKGNMPRLYWPIGVPRLHWPIGVPRLYWPIGVPRLQWPIGVVVNVNPRRHGLIRSVNVKT
ncbi:uncharacterized protein [Palaemon carinicauda]|uniref:uncharacterized protein n=1 Tax=Palaemon carinicauda TaxID=392227 RepID=UPI0035B5900D